MEKNLLISVPGPKPRCGLSPDKVVKPRDALGSWLLVFCHFKLAGCDTEGGEVPKRSRAVVLLGAWGSRRTTLELSQGAEHPSGLRSAQASRLTPGSPIATHKCSVLLLCHL